jgi:lipid-binding SYLF domain-containing protein
MLCPPPAPAFPETPLRESDPHGRSFPTLIIQRFELGVGPSIVVVDEGFGKATTTTTIKKGIYAFIFDQKGLMAGLGLQGSKITRISK